MANHSKKELLLVVERQEDQLRRYEARLRDVVQAYKGLQKEKTALEKSLKVLSPCGNRSLESNTPIQDKTLSAVDQPGTDDDSKNDDGKPSGHCANPTNKTEEPSKTSDADRDLVSVKDEGDSSSQNSLQAQVETLRETLKTVMEQKSITESSFQADRKKHLQELEKKIETFANERDEFHKMKGKMQQDIDDLRKRMRQEQQAREADQNDHAIMLREMQEVLSKERAGKEGLQSKIDHLTEALARKEAQRLGDSTNEDKHSKKENEAHSNEEKDDDQVSDSEASPTLVQLQLELVKMKTQLEKDILSEQRRANEAEARAAMIARAEEQRVADLEAKLSELSEVVGKYERLRSHDQSEIQKLKERLYLLSSSNKEENIKDNRIVENDSNKSNVDNDNNLNDAVRKVKAILQLRARNSEEDCLEDVTGFSKAELECILKNDPAHKACLEELRQLKDEFERYKSKVQTLRKERLESETESKNETSEKLKNRITHLENTIKVLEEELDANEKEHLLSSETSSRAISELRMKQALELENERTLYSAKLQELENQVRNQRSRTLSLITEKDCEIEKLKAKLAECSPPSELKKKPGVYKTSGSSDATVKELLSQSTPSSLLCYAQEQAFCEAELESLRKQRLDMEDTIRDLQQREDQGVEQIRFLKEEIRKLERNRSRENANLEYVKNVILRYLLSDSDSVRQQMIAAISTILEFSPQELSSVKRRSKSWWGR